MVHSFQDITYVLLCDGIVLEGIQIEWLAVVKGYGACRNEDTQSVFQQEPGRVCIKVTEHIDIDHPPLRTRHVQ